MMEVLANTMVVIVLQHIGISYQHIVYLKLMQYYMSITSYKDEERNRGFGQRHTGECHVTGRGRDRGDTSVSQGIDGHHQRLGRGKEEFSFLAFIEIMTFATP